MLKTKKLENFGSLAPLARNKLWKFLNEFLVFWTMTYHEYYKQKDIIVPTIYVIDQQDLKELYV